MRNIKRDELPTREKMRPRKCRKMRPADLRKNKS